MNDLEKFALPEKERERENQREREPRLQKEFLINLLKLHKGKSQ